MKFPSENIPNVGYDFGKLMAPTLNLQFFREFKDCLLGLERDFHANFKGITAKVVPHLSSIEFEVREAVSAQKIVGAEFLLCDRDVTIINLATGQAWTENHREDCFAGACLAIMAALADHDKKELDKFSRVRQDSPALGGT